MKIKLIIALLALTLLAAGCATETNNVENTVPTEPVVNVEEEEESIPTGDYNIQIINGQFDVDEITLTKGEEVTLVIHNRQDVTARFEIPMYGSEVNTDIPADGYDVVTVTPGYVGYHSMELNGATLGTITVEE